MIRAEGLKCPPTRPAHPADPQMSDVSSAGIRSYTVEEVTATPHAKPDMSSQNSPLISDLWALQLRLPVHRHLSTVLDFHVFGRPELKACRARLPTAESCPRHV